MVKEQIMAGVVDVKAIIVIMAFIVAFGLLLAVFVFPTVYLVNIIRYRVLSTPLNMHHPAFVFLNMLDMDFRKRWSPKDIFLTYRVFLLFPVLLMLCSLWITFMYWKEQGKNFRWSWHIASIWAIPVLILSLTLGALTIVAAIVRQDSKTIRRINANIQSKMSTASAFNALSDPNVDRLTQITKYRNILQQFETDNPEEYAKALFTVNLYLVLYEMGQRHENIDNALQPFQGYSRLIRANFVRFFSPQSVYFPNRIAEITANAPASDQALEEQAKAIASKWIGSINNDLGSITYTSTFVAFFLITIILIVIYWAPLKIASELKLKLAT